MIITSHHVFYGVGCTHTQVLPARVLSGSWADLVAGEKVSITDFRREKLSLAAGASRALYHLEHVAKVFVSDYSPIALPATGPVYLSEHDAADRAVAGVMTFAVMMPALALFVEVSLLVFAGLKSLCFSYENGCERAESRMRREGDRNRTLAV